MLDAEGQGLEFYGGDPQLLYPSALGRYRAMMLAGGWTPGPDEEELLEFAMHESQYRDYMTALSSSCSCIPDSKSAVAGDAVYAAIAMALHEYGSKEIIS